MSEKISFANIELKVKSLDATRDFYSDLLGLNQLNFDRKKKILAYLVGNTTLRFRELSNFNDEYTKGVGFIGLELESFEHVDKFYQKIIKLKPEIIYKDVRVKYKDQQGPYGFFIKDPDGYILKIHKYNMSG